MFVRAHELASGPTPVFYERLNEVLREAGFDGWLESLGADFYAEGGRPSIPPGTYFRMLLIGYFEAIESQRGIAWRCQDSLSLRTFLRFSLNEATPDHSSISKIGSRFPLEVYEYEAVFAFVLKLVGSHGLLKGKTVGVDSTLLQANAAMKSIVRKETGDWRAYLQRLAAVEGLERQTREELARFDQQRKKDGKKKASNEEWESKTEDRRRLAHHEDEGRQHAPGPAFLTDDRGGERDRLGNRSDPRRGDHAGEPRGFGDDPRHAGHRHRCGIDTTGEDRVPEAVADKGYCKLKTLSDGADHDLATSFSEPKVNGERRWHDNPEA